MRIKWINSKLNREWIKLFNIEIFLLHIFFYSNSNENIFLRLIYVKYEWIIKQTPNITSYSMIDIIIWSF